MRPISGFLTLFVVLLLPLPAQADTNILFILDGSNSMWGQIEGESKITSAQSVLGGLLNELPSDIQTGLMVYGHREEGSCKDIEVLSRIGESSIDTLIRKINALKPKGKTPIAGALQESLSVLSQYEGENNNVVLISDGIESCDGDPCAAAKALAGAGINARVHVIGFDVGEEQRKQLECIPRLGNGKYFSAANAAELKLAAAEVKEVAVAAPPEPVVWFEDNFDGDELADHWEVINPNPDGFIVEDGVLTILTSGHTPLIGNDELENFFRLTKNLPEGDWTATMRFTPKVATFRERYILALYKDKDNMLTATLGNYAELEHGKNIVNLRADKVSKGTVTSFDAKILGSHHLGGFLTSALQEYLDWTAANEQGILIRIKKSGRSYIVSSKIEGDLTMADGKEPQWVEVQKLTSLRQPGDSLVIALTQAPFGGNTYFQVAGGEALIAVDWIKVEAFEEAE